MPISGIVSFSFVGENFFYHCKEPAVNEVYNLLPMSTIQKILLFQYAASIIGVYTKIVNRGQD
jgi:hypothetical protein